MKRAKELVDNSVSKSWFCVFNNPEKHGFEGTPEEIVDQMIETWIEGNPQRNCAVAYCISAEGLPHCHAVFEDLTAMRFSAIKKLYPQMHIEPTKGSKAQAEDYIYKRKGYEEKGETVVYIASHGEIEGRQGKNSGFELIAEMIEQGRTPNEILDLLPIEFRRYEKIIRDTYFRKRFKETPYERNIAVYWHVGESGTGKSFKHIKLIKEHGEDRVCYIAEYSNGFDRYNGEFCLFLDEYKAQLPYEKLLRILDKYKTQIAARYTNGYALWTEVHITSVFLPEKIYEMSVKKDEQKTDSYEQLKRRITYIVYHYKKNGEFCEYEMPMSEYRDYAQLKHAAALQDLSRDENNTIEDGNSAVQDGDDSITGVVDEADGDIENPFTETENGVN